MEVINFVKELSFEQVQLECEKLKIRVKSHDNLYMLNFMDDADFTNPIVRQANGVIFEKETNKLVHYSFEKYYENSSVSNDTYDLDLKYDEYGRLLGGECYPFIEGSLIKVYYYNNAWCVSTSKCIDASRSYWSSNKSFDELFRETVLSEGFYDKLDKNCCYTYILQHPEIITINQVLKPKLILLNTINPDTVDSIYCKNSDIPIDNECYVIHLDHGKSVKVLSDNFVKWKSILSEYKDIGMIYYANINNKEITDYLQTRFVSVDFKMYDDILLKVAKNIHNLYFGVYINRNVYLVPGRYQRTLYQLHARFHQTKEKTTLSIVLDKLKSLKPKTLAYVLGYRY